MPNVDSLNISISATAQKASGALDTLIGKLGHLQSAISSINTGGLNNMANGINAVSNAMGSLKSVNAADFNRLAKGIQNLGNLNSTSISNAARAINQLGNSIRIVSTTNFSGTTQIADLAKAIAQLGYKSSTQAIANIPKLATAMTQLITALSKVPQVSQNVIALTTALAMLARTGASSGKAATALSQSLNNFSKASKKAKADSFSLASAIGKVYATYWLLFRAFRKIKEAMDISSQLTEVQNVVNTTFGEYSHLLDEISKTSITEFGISELSVKKTASNFQAMGTAMGFTRGKMADMSIELTKLSADMASFYNVSQEEVAEDLQSVFTGMTRPLRQYGLDLTEATLKEWALANGMNANIKSMSQAEKTMLRYQYVMANTGAAQGDFARTSMTWANQTRILVENFKALGSVLGGTFINVFKPLVVALNEAMAALIAFAETVSNSLGKIFGWQYEAGGTGGMTSDFEDAEISAGGIEDSTGKTADNVEKIKKGLRAFDELKTISIDTGSKGGSGGGGAGGGASASGSGGQWVRTESIFEDYESTLDSLYKLGDYIGTKLTDALNGIDWNDVYKGAQNFGTGLANFLNGLISPELFGALGRTIGNSINTVLHGLNSYVETFDWRDFGKSLATGLSNFLKSWNFKLTAETFSNIASGILSGLASFFSTLGDEKVFETIGQKIVDFICGVKWGKLIWSLADLFLGLASAIISAPSDLLEGVAEAIASKISGTPVELDMPVLLRSIKVENLFNFDLTHKLTGYAEEAFKNAGKAIRNGKIDAFLVESFNAVLATVSAGLVFPFEPLIDALSYVWNTAKKWWVENVWLPTIEAPFVAEPLRNIKDAYNQIIRWWKNDRPSLDEIKTKVENIKTRLLNAWSTARTWWNENKPSLSKVKFTVPDLKKMLDDAWKKAKTWWDKNVKLKIPKLNFQVTYKSPSGAIQKAIVKALSLKGWPSLQFFANGGFPEDGTFRASHGEIMGRFDNGKSVVANNKQITDGISAAVYQGNRENNALLRQEIQLMQRQNELLSELLKKETGISAREIFESVRTSAYEYNRRTGNPAFI